MQLKLIFYSSNLQGIDRAVETAPEKRLGTHILVDWLGWAGSGVGELPHGWRQGDAGGAQGEACGGTWRCAQQKAFAVLFDLLSRSTS